MFLGIGSFMERFPSEDEVANEVVSAPLCVPIVKKGDYTKQTARMILYLSSRIYCDVIPPKLVCKESREGPVICIYVLRSREVPLIGVLSLKRCWTYFS